MMIHLMRAETRKLLSTHTWLWMLLTCLATTALGVVINITGTPNDAELAGSVRTVLLSATSGLVLIPLFILGVLGITSEYRHQTLTPTALATPSRARLATAKLLAYTLIGASYGLACLTVQTAIAVPWLASRGVPVDLTEHTGTLLTGLAVLTLFTLIGLGVGTLLKNQVLAVSLGFVFLAVLSNLLLAIPKAKHTYPYLPTGAVNAIVTAPDEPRELNGINILSAWGGLLALGTWALATTTLGSAVTMRRDIT